MPILGFTTILVLLCLFPVLRATADSGASSADIEVVAEVGESTPSANPVESVKLTENKTVGAAYASITLVDLEPFSFVQIYVQSEPILVASGFADKAGVFTCKAIIPSSLPPGNHTILASRINLGATTPSLKSLVKFAVAIDGVVSRKVKHSGSGGGASNVSESPAPRPTETTPVKSQEFNGVINVGGLKIETAPTFAWSGQKLTAQIAIQNVYKKKYSVNVRIQTLALGIFKMAPDRVYHLENLKKNETRVLVQTIREAGQWGFYSSKFTVYPPRSIDGLTLRPIARESSIFAPPLIPLSIFAVILLAEALRRFVLEPRRKTTRWLKEMALEAERNEALRLAAEREAALAKTAAKPKSPRKPAKSKRLPSDEAEK